MTVKFVTIGVYGWEPEGFFRALQDAGVDTFCDVRWRRGVRGREYAFANSQRLQQRLEALGIRYIHRRDLAPAPAVRAAQTAVDKAGKVAKRQRTQLAAAFAEGYATQVLADFVQKEMSGLTIAPQDFAAGAWIDHVPTLLALPRRSPNRPNGADQVADFLRDPATA